MTLNSPVSTEHLQHQAGEELISRSNPRQSPHTLGVYFQREINGAFN